MRLEPGPELWLHRIIEDETVGAALSPNDRSDLVMIARLAFKVRAWQREFFKTHSSESLFNSKEAERALDSMLGERAQGSFDL